MTANKVKQVLKRLASQERALSSARFFKTGPGQYGAGDKFLGITVPEQRTVAKRFVGLTTSEVAKLLASSYHEHRLTGLLILVKKFEIASSAERRVFVNFYLKQRAAVNNWDLVDSTASRILGTWLLNHDRKILDKLASSKNLWSRRIAMIATLAFIKEGELQDTWRLAEKLLNDKHDLTHKAVGWMLREAGKKDQLALKKFLDKFGQRMPRTMLRYALEKFSPAERQHYLKLKYV